MKQEIQAILTTQMGKTLQSLSLVVGLTMAAGQVLSLIHI